MGLLGGINMPIVPPVEATAAEKLGEYLLFTMAGIIIDPMAAVVAGPDPESAAKNIQDSMVTTANPPGMFPAISYITSIILSVIPAFFH